MSFAARVARVVRLLAVFCAVTLPAVAVTAGDTKPSNTRDRGAASRPDVRRALTSAAVAQQQVVVSPEEDSVALFEGALRTDDGRIQVMIELEEPSAAVVFAEAMKGAKPSDMRARRIAGNATRMQVDRIQSEQDGVAAQIAIRGIQARELFRVQKALNGIAVAVTSEQVSALRALAGVKRVIPIYPEYPTNSTSVPFIGTPNVWANTIGLPAGADGTGISIGVIDTGLDYMHGSFGGTGVLADYQAESADTAAFTTVGTVAAGSFPTTKVVGGTDFAGDAYTGSNAPVADANPMDCNGHGSHVAGTAAGFGVTTGDTTFTGPYDANPSTYSALKIGPGTAPQARLYGLRVFGCAGSTGLTTLAIDWAMDPNNDDDLADHLDVINMSLGSNFGSVTNASSVASDNAALAGVIVVTSAGNASDTFFISGAPGAGSRVIATASSVDSGVAAVSVQLNSPPSIAGNFLGGSAAYGPAPSGQTANAVISVDPTAPAAAGPLTTDACGALTNAAAMAGNICIVDRGTCSFKTKTLNCQVAGAIGAIIINNAPGWPPPGMADDALIVTPITIPTIMITQSEGTTLKNTITATPPVNMTLLGQNGADTMSSFSSRGPRRIVGSPLRLKPDIAAPGQSITSVQTGKTCLVAAGCTGVFHASGFQAGNQALTISGTSMAAPHMAGIMALLRQLKPDWSVEELKALAMNYAIENTSLYPNDTAPRFGPSRIGAGRVVPDKAALGDVIAMNAEDAGLVSVTFSPEVVGLATQTKKVRVVNKGTTSQTYTLAFDNVTDSPGVAYSLPGGSSVTVAAGESVELDVLMTATPALMDHTRDPALFPTQGVQANYGDQPRNFLTEEGSYLTFSQSAVLMFRLPVYMAERPASTMSAGSIATGGAPTGSTTIALSGGDLCTGTLAAGPTCTGSFPTDVESLVSPFELQVVSATDPVNSTDYADIKYAGAAYLPGVPSNINNDLIMFGLASWGDWSTPSDVAYNVCVDTNEDGIYDKSVINSNPAIFVAGASFNDNFVRVVQDLTTGGFSILGLASFVNLVAPTTIDTALHLNNVMVLGTSPAQLGMIAGDTTFRYKVVTCPGTNPGCARTTGANDHCSPSAAVRFDQAPGPYFYNWAAQGLDFGGNFLDEDLNGNTLPVSWNTANMATNGSVGALLLHHHNKAGTRAEVVLLDTASSTDLSVVAGSTPSNPALGTNVTITVTLTNTGTAATGVVVSVPLPDDLTWVSDDSSGAYSTATGLWTIGAVPVGSQTLTIIATVDTTDPLPVLAEITSGTPLDPNPANDQSSFVISAPRSSDLVATMSSSGATAFAGDPISYTITLTNNGVDPAYSIDVADSFPAFPALDPATATPSQGVFDTGTNTWNLAGLGTGGTATLVLGLNAPNMAGPLQNTAVATSTTADPNAVNNTDSETIQIVSPSNVTGTKVNAGQTYEGGTITYTVTLNNGGAYDQQNNAGSEFVDVLPSTMTLVSASASSGTATATIGTNTVDWNGSIPAAGSVTITITATVNNTAVVGNTITNNGTINYDADGNGSNEATNPVSSSFTVTSPATITATMTAAGTFQPGSNVTYTAILANSGPSDQLDNPGDEFSAQLPSSMTLVSVNSSALATETALRGEPVANAGETATWNGVIPAGGDVTITIVAQIDPLVAGGTVISYQGTANFDADGNGTNESSTQTNDPSTGTAGDATAFAVISPATVAAPTKSVNTRLAQVGDAIVYTITISNTGSSAQSDNPGDEFVDVLPTSLDLVSASASSGTALATIPTRTVTWNGSIPVSGSVTITINATVNATATGTVINQGTVNFDADGDGTNDSSVVTDDPETSATGDPTAFATGAASIPALSPMALLFLSALLGGAALLALRRMM